MTRTLRDVSLGLVASTLVLAAAVQSASAQANTREVSMVRQDFSDCPNNDVRDTDPARVGGTAVVVRNADASSTVKVAITAAPNTKYNFFLKCVRSLGVITTYEEGEGEAQFTFRTDEAGSVFAFDMYPEGAPAGNKFQSVQVKF